MSEVSLAGRVPVEDLPAALEPMVRKRIPGAESARITGWRPAPQGFSTETFLFDVEGVAGPDGRSSSLPLVFRRPPEHAVLPDFDLRRQYLTMARLAPSPVPVPEVLWLDTDPTLLGTPYFLMRRIENIVGVSDVPPYHQAGIFADTDDIGRATLWNGCVDLIATVHALDPAAYRLGFLDLGAFGATAPERLVNFLEYGVTWASDGAPLPPAFGRAIDWLRTNLYMPERVTVCWGDSRMSNVLYSPDFAPVAALDWEVAYLGDPGGDLAWMFLTDWVSSPFPDRAPTPGTPSRDETLDRYAERAGYRLRNMHFHDLTATLLLAMPLIRLNRMFASEDFDLTQIGVDRLELLMGGD